LITNFEKVLGKRWLTKFDLPDMGSEDFSEYLFKIPGCYFNIGNGRLGKEPVENHNLNFNFNDKILATATYLWVKVVEDRFGL
jgi:hippurate hydrolase